MRSILVVLCLLSWDVLAVSKMGLALAQQAPSSPQLTAPALDKRPGFLGIEVRDITQEEAEKLGFDAPTGVWVEKSLAGGPAEAAGLAADDVILTIDGVELAGSETFTTAERAKGAGISSAAACAPTGQATDRGGDACRASDCGNGIVGAEPFEADVGHGRPYWPHQRTGMDARR